MSSTQLTVGVALIKLLEQYQVEHVFGIPGVHTIELYRGLAASSIEHHTPRHEQGAGFMADGYARVSRKPGVCFVITGPGLTNIATAMGQALADSIPMLVISSVNDTIASSPARGMLHEMPDQLAFSSEVSRFSQTVHTDDQLAGALAKAFTLFASERAGPVHLQLPVSLLATPTSHPPGADVPRLPPRPVASSESIDAAADLLNSAKRPAILAGGGAIDAAAEICQLAEKLDAPVHMTINARGLLPHTHALAVPASCTFTEVREVLDQADVVLALGTELAQTDYDQYKDDSFAIAGQLIRCDIDALQIDNNFAASVGLVGDVQLTVERLLDCVHDRTEDQRCGTERAAAAMQMAFGAMDNNGQRHLRLLEVIRDTVPDAVFVGDSTQLVYSGNMIFNTRQPRQWLNSSVGFGTLGYALPAAVGAALGAENKPVVCLIGDGGLQFVLGELGTLKDEGLAVAVVVWCNGGYLEIKHSMERADVSLVGVEFTVPDCAAVAGAYGIAAAEVGNEKELCDAVKRCFESCKPVVIVVDEAQIM